MDFINALRLSYLGVTSGALLVTVTPALRDRFLAYGPRASTSGSEKEQTKSPSTEKSSFIVSLLDTIASWTVPHDYFWTFYFLSTTLSLFWLGEILFLKGPTFNAIDRYTDVRAGSMSFEQVKITWIMMFVQGSRRLYESLLITSPAGSKSSSKMQAWHWVLGLLFYLAMSMTVWVEGIPALRYHKASFRDLAFHSPSFRIVFGVVLFILASGLQHDCHVHLAHLKSSKSKSENESQKESSDTYKIPTHPAFQSLIAPHYTAECLIYVSLAIVGAPKGHFVNLTLASALVFVVMNLGVTAGFTRKWYEKRFGSEAVKGKWNMIPWVY